MASSGNDGSSDLEYETCGKIAQLVLTRIEYLVDGLDTLQESAYQGEEYGCHSQSSPIQTHPDNWEAQVQGSESMDQDIIEEKYKGQDNLNEHGQCSDHYSHHPIGMIVLKPEEVVEGGEEQNGGIIDARLQVKKEEMEEDTLMHNERSSHYPSYRSTIEIHTQQPQNNELDQDQVFIEGKYKGQVNLHEHDQCSDHYPHHPIEMIVLKPEKVIGGGEEEEQNGGIVDEALQVKKEKMEEDTVMYNESFSPYSSYRSTIGSYTPQLPNTELDQDQDIIEKKYKGQDNLNEHGQCSYHYSLHPIEMIVLKPEEVVGEGEEGPHVKKEDPLMHIESFTSHSSYRSTIEPHTQEHLKVEDVEGIEGGEPNKKYNSSFTMMQIQDFSPNSNTKIDNFKSENDSNVINTQHISTEPIGNQDSSTFNTGGNDSTGISLLTQTPHVYSNKSYTCKYCNYETNKKFVLTRHLHTHTGERPNSCVFCDKTFNYKSHLTSHLRTHTGEKPYNCEFCDKTFNQKSTLTTHLYTNTGEKPHSCKFCDKTFNQKSNLTKHLYTHTGERPYSCDHGDKTFNQKSNLTTHLLTHTGEKPHSCELCDYKTAQKSHLNTHLLTHTGEKPHSCKFCDKTFNQKSNLTTHLLTHTGEKPHSCELCDYKTAHKSDLNRHLLTHTGERPYSCDFCDYKTARKSVLTRHLYTHTGEIPHSCELCDYKTAQKSHLNTHLLTHTGEKTHSCEFCDKTFSHKSSLTSHLLTHTGEKPHSCLICDFKTARKSYLNKHMRRHTS